MGESKHREGLLLNFLLYQKYHTKGAIILIPLPEILSEVEEEMHIDIMLRQALLLDVTCSFGGIHDF